MTDKIRYISLIIVYIKSYFLKFAVAVLHYLCVVLYFSYELNQLISHTINKLNSSSIAKHILPLIIFNS